MRRLVTAALVSILILAATRPAEADATVFYGIGTDPTNRPSRGAAVGFGLVIVAFEFEYSSVSRDDYQLAPSLRIGSGNVLVQTPTSGFQLYGTVGGGVYKESFGDVDISLEGTGFATNLGGGAKIKLAGPLRVRVDYRVFKLAGDAVYSTTQRFYVGANINF